MKIVLVIAFLIMYARSDTFYYSKVVTCAQNDTAKCTKWTEATRLKYYKSFTTYCFSQNTYVQTSQGPKPMKQLKIGDEVFGLDVSTGKNAFSKVKAWLHRDQKAIAQYDILRTKDNITFEASDLHNIAYVNSEGKIDFKFERDLSPGDQLVGYPQEDPIVSSTAAHEERKGLYTPFTDIGNYYIFHDLFDPTKFDEKVDPMILVHVLSHVKNPISQFRLANIFIDFKEFLQPTVQQQLPSIYIHPLIANFNILFGSDWTPNLQEVKYPIEDHQQVRPSNSSSSYSPSYTSYKPSSSYSYYSSPSYSSSIRTPYYSSSGCGRHTSGYYSNSYGGSNYQDCDDEQQRQTEMQALALSISLIQQQPIL